MMSVRGVAPVARVIAEDSQQIRRRPNESELAGVLQLIETGGPGGAERMLLNLGRSLGNGYAPTVGLIKAGWLATQTEAAGLPLVMVRGRAAGDIGVMTALLRIVLTRRIRLVHAHEFYMAALGAAVSRLTGVPLVVTVHGKGYYPERRRRRWLYRLVAAQAAVMVTVSRDLKEFLCRVTGTPSGRVEVIYNGIDPEPWARVSRDGELLKSVGVPPDARVLGAVGNLYPVKGHLHLIQAARAVVAVEPSAHLVILGRGTLKGALEAEAERLGIRSHVHLLGLRDDVPNWLGAMDVFVLPSLSEGLPLSVLEAMAAGRPIVATKVGGVPEVVEDGVTGFLVPPAAPDALAERMLAVLGDPVRATTMGAAGRARVQATFSLPEMANRYRALYQRVVARRSPLGSGAEEP